jgi:hypothetical protein
MRECDHCGSHGSVRTGIWQASPKKRHNVEIIGEHPKYPEAIIIKCHGKEIVTLKSEVTENIKAPNGEISGGAKGKL